jgi:hypothetical protein
MRRGGLPSPNGGRKAKIQECPGLIEWRKIQQGNIIQVLMKAGKKLQNILSVLAADASILS